MSQCSCLRHKIIDQKRYGVYFFFDSKGRGTFAYRTCPDEDRVNELVHKDKEHRELIVRNRAERLVESVSVYWYEEYKKEWKTPIDLNDGRVVMTRKERYQLWYNTWSNCKKCVRYLACHFYIRDDTHMCPYYDNGMIQSITPP